MNLLGELLYLKPLSLFNTDLRASASIPELLSLHLPLKLNQESLWET